MKANDLFRISVITLAQFLSVSAVAGVCGGEDLRQSAPLLYSASFKLGGSSGKIQSPLNPMKSMKVVIGMSRLKEGAFSKPFPVAQIWSGSQCQAVCKVASVEKDNPLTPVAVEMSCESVGFSPLAVKAQILWGGDKMVYMAKRPTIRFGTWLEGYSDAPLKVELDHYSMGSHANRSVSELAQR